MAERRPQPQLACEKCSLGIMDTTNPHLYGECDCNCHDPKVEQVTPGVWEQVEGALPHLGPGALSPEAQQQVEALLSDPKVEQTTTTAAAIATLREWATIWATPGDIAAARAGADALERQAQVEPTCSCGHPYAIHKWRGPGTSWGCGDCTCFAWEPPTEAAEAIIRAADPKVEQAGDPQGDFYEDDEPIPKITAILQRGPQGVTGPPDPDLDTDRQVIAAATQAAADALRHQHGLIWSEAAVQRQAKLCVEAAWPLLVDQVERLQRDLRDAQAQVSRLHQVLDELIWVADFGAEQDEYCKVCHGSRPDHHESCFIGAALHRALGLIGHTAPSCKAEAELEKFEQAAWQAWNNQDIDALCHALTQLRVDKVIAAALDRPVAAEQDGDHA